ncbi:hypothetical protein C8R45DRAFT_946255, partial [Mycena sanguinolenta]
MPSDRKLRKQSAAITLPSKAVATCANTSRPAKIKIFASEELEPKSKPYNLTGETELEHHRKLFEEWDEDFKLDLTTEAATPERTTEEQELEIERYRTWDWAVKVCLEAMPELDRQEWLKEQRNAESLARARASYRTSLSATLSDFTPSPGAPKITRFPSTPVLQHMFTDVARGEWSPKFHVAAHFTWNNFSRGIANTDGEISEREWGLGIDKSDLIEGCKVGILNTAVFNYDTGFQLFKAGNVLLDDDEEIPPLL